MLEDKRGSYIFSLILLLAQVVFREEVLTFCINVRELSLKRNKRGDQINEDVRAKDPQSLL